jgi:hypothetical protein
MAPDTGVRNRDGVPQLRDIESDKGFPIIRHGSSSCDEDRLGQSEQPSDAQSRASHLTHRRTYGLTVYGATLMKIRDQRRAASRSVANDSRSTAFAGLGSDSDETSGDIEVGSASLSVLAATTNS